MEIFISHAHEDKALARAWSELLNCVSNGQVDPWYSSDDRADSGIAPGSWREQIHQKLESADILLIIVTPGSNERPWLLWESGFAAGKSKIIIPIVFFLRHDRIHSVFETKQKYDGESKDDALQLCERIVMQATGKAVPAAVRQVWTALVDRYLETVQHEKTVSLSKRLFHKHFHNEQEAENLAGTWFACWTEIPQDQSPEVVWETDLLQIWAGETRLRVVGYSGKRGIENASSAEFYPMEGVVSARGYVALSYWSGGSIPICGTCLLKPEGAAGDTLSGHWQGFTARDLSLEPRFVQGRVVMSKRKEVVETFFGFQR